MKIGEKIKFYREEKKLTQKQLGEKLGVSQQMIGLYETGARNPKSDTIRKIAEALEINPSDLLYDEEIASPYITEQSFDPSIIKYIIDKTITDKSNIEKKIYQNASPTRATINAITITKHKLVKEKDFLEIYNLLNFKGKQKLYEYAVDLIKIKEYQLKD